MIDWSLLKVMHRHDDGWAALEPIDHREGGGHHDAVAHDPERSVGGWVRRFRCASCAEDVLIGTEAPPDDQPR